MKILHQVEKILDRHNFSFAEWHGCFDIAARRKDLLLIKVLDNVDSFQEAQADNLRILSDSLSANVSLVGTHTRYDELVDDVVYERFDIPTFTPDTLDSILDRHFPLIYRDKGGLFSEVNPVALRKAREHSGMTQQELADKSGVTKKSVYEHESRQMKAREETVSKMEKLLGAKIRVAFAPSSFASETEARPQDSFEKDVARQLERKGFDTGFVRQTPFNVIAKEKFVILSDAEQNAHKIQRKMTHLENFSTVSKKPMLIITEHEISAEIPTIEKRRLRELSARELWKIAKA